MKAERVVWCMNSKAHFGHLVSRALDAPLVVDGPVGDCDLVYIVGLYDPPFYGFTLANTARARRRVVHWCGQDVLTLWDPSRVPEALHVCESEALREELLAKGVDAAVAPMPAYYDFEVTPFSPTPVVAAYGGTNPAYYGAPLVQAAWECMPGVRFLSYTAGQFDESSMREAVRTAWVHLRLPAHDGGALGAKEYLAAGRRALVTVDLPHARRVRHDDLAEIVDALREMLSEREPDLEAAEYWKQENRDERFRAQIEELL